VTQRCW